MHLEERLLHPPGALDGHGPSCAEDVLEDRVGVVDVVRAQRPAHLSSPRPVVSAHVCTQKQARVTNGTAAGANGSFSIMKPIKVEIAFAQKGARAKRLLTSALFHAQKARAVISVATRYPNACRCLRPDAVYESRTQRILVRLQRTSKIQQSALDCNQILKKGKCGVFTDA